MRSLVKTYLLVLELMNTNCEEPVFLQWELVNAISLLVRLSFQTVMLPRWILGLSKLSTFGLKEAAVITYIRYLETFSTLNTWGLSGDLAALLF